MASIKDYVDDNGNPKTPEPGKAEKKDEQAALTVTEEPTEPKPDDDIPEKFRGKTAKELVKMYQEVEQYAGRKGQEAGETQRRLEELQKTVDTLILQGQKPEEEEVDYFSDPKEAISKGIENHPKFKQLEKQLHEFQSMSATQQLFNKHPDAAEIARSQDFVNWVQDETGRQALFKQVQNNDPIAADALLSDFKKSRNKPKDNQKSEAKRASTGVTTASTAPTSRKVYRRHEIIELMKSDPKKYQHWLKDDGHRAYAEGRVR